MMEKSTLPLLETRPQLVQVPQKRGSLVKGLIAAAALCYAGSHIFSWLGHHHHHHHHHHHGPPSSGSGDQCRQIDPMFPATGHEGLDRMWEYIATEAFRNGSIARHSGAVQIPTQSFDDLGKIGEDARWDVMYKFADYLKATFPRIHKDLKSEKINVHGLLFTWKGSDESLKPLVLMAHQDTVPVPDSTIDAWTYPPWSGHFDGKFIWGRGSSDCKNQLIAIMEVVELLLDAEFKPARTIILSFGFDEEISGKEGAGHLSQTLLERYGKDGIAAIVDEGAGIAEAWGTVFALPGVAEKGYTDVDITVRYPGGHSSVPTDHTGIGIISEIIREVESVQYPTYLDEKNPFLSLLQCGAEHASEFPKKLKKQLKKRPSTKSCKHKHKPRRDELALEAARIGGPGVKYLMQTSQATDLISGGVKINALPERVQATINHRINIGDTPEIIYEHLTSLIKPIAKKFNLTLHAFDDVAEAPSSISLRARANELRVAPVTPTEVDSATPYSILAGTTRAVYGTEVYVSPGLMTGNTDCRYVWDLTRHIFRYAPGYDPQWSGGLSGVHTVDEKVSVENHIAAVKWFTLFIRNMDMAQLEVPINLPATDTSGVTSSNQVWKM